MLMVRFWFTQMSVVGRPSSDVRLPQQLACVAIVLMPSLKLGHVGSKTRSMGQILEKPFVHSTGHDFDPIFMKLSQNVCLHEI